MTKISSFVKLTAQPGKRDELADALRTMYPTVEEETGTEIYAINFDNADENAVWMFELYTDNDALVTHGGSAAMANLFGLLGPLLDGAPLMVFCTPTDAKGFDL